MVDEPLWECTFFIPVRRDAHLSDGQTHPAEAWEWLDSYLFQQFRGGTAAPGLFEGFYEDPDTKQRVTDQSYQFIVAVRQADLDELRALLKEAKFVFQQKCIYLSIGGRVEFV